MLLITLSLLLRSLWFTLRSCGYDTAWEHFINRLAMYVLISAFSAYLQSWITVVLSMHDAEADASGSVVGRCDRYACGASWTLNISLYAAMFTLSTIYFATGSDEDDDVYNASIYLVAFVAAIAGLIFLVLGLCTHASLRRASRSLESSTEVHSASRRRASTATAKVVAVSLVCFIFFSVKCAFWLYEPITGRYSAKGTYPLWFYTAVEIVPAAAIFIGLVPWKQVAHEAENAAENSVRSVLQVTSMGTSHETVQVEVVDARGCGTSAAASDVERSSTKALPAVLNRQMSSMPSEIGMND